MSKKYKVINDDTWKEFGLKVGDIVTKVEASTIEDLFELPKHLHGHGHTAFTRLNLKEPNYLFIDMEDLEEIKELGNE